MNEHRVTVVNSGRAIEAKCTCGQWAIDSSGTDETSRLYVDAAKRAHLGGVAK
jgi:hypothetical protein